jgi:hypothetical protein
MMNVEECTTKRSWLILRHYSEASLRERGKFLPSRPQTLRKCRGKRAQNSECAGVAVRFKTRIRKVPESNFGQTTGYHRQQRSWFPSISTYEFRGQYLPNPYQ